MKAEIAEEFFQVVYDDQPHDAGFSAITAVNKLLKDLGSNIQFKIEDDNLPHDGYMIFKVKLIESEDNNKSIF